MRRPAKKSIAIFSAAVLAIAGTGIAFAYWTSTGSGEGTAATGDAVTNLTIVQTSTVTDLRPGGAAQPLTAFWHEPSASRTWRMNMDSGRQLRADGHAGVQRSHRVLKYHGKQ